MHDDRGFTGFVIPGLTRNPFFLWIPAFAGMTASTQLMTPIVRWK